MKRFFWAFLSLSGLVACQTTQQVETPYAEEIVVEEQIVRPSFYSELSAVEMAASDGSVRVFPVNKSISEIKAASRSNVRRGYQVFDESVEVFSIGIHSQKPDYIADYAVPEFIEPKHVKYALLPQPVTNKPTPLVQSDEETKPTIQRRSRPVLTGY